MLIYMALIDSPSDQEKFEQIYSEYYAFLLYVANLILHNEHDAEDAVHEAFISVARNIKKVKEVDSPRTKSFLSVITERKAIDIYNKRKKLQVVELTDDMVGIPVEDSGEQDVAWAINQLSPRYREMITLKYRLGYTTKECAEILKIEPATASKLDQRAKARLEELCRKGGIL